MSPRHHDRVCFITGGSSGMGYATAKLLLIEGAKVAIVARLGERLKHAAEQLDGGERLLAVGADMARVDQISSALEQTREAFGMIDVVFANAGAGQFNASEEVTEDDFDRLVDLNFKGVFFTLQKALPLMNDGGAIIVNASWTLHRAMQAGAVYAATKAAVHNLARSFAISLGQRGIRVNSISPGFINTAQFNEESAGEQKAHAYQAQVPLGRFGQPDEIARVVSFLASDEASYINGHDVLIDGGLVPAFHAGQSR